MGAAGTAVLDFGATPVETASVAVIGQSGILAASHVEAFFMGSDTTIDNGADEHEEAAVLCPLSCKQVVPGIGFTIVAYPIAALGMGTFIVHWVWA